VTVTGKKVLLVDDEPLLLKGLERCLRGHGLEVTCVTSAEAALEAAEGASYDLCFLDVRMGGMDGITALQRLREISPQTHVAVMTASWLTPEEKDFLVASADYFLTKPFDLSAVQEIIEAMLGDWGQVSQNR
jgi:CheY-like chemotaxis protein